MIDENRRVSMAEADSAVTTLKSKIPEFNSHLGLTPAHVDTLTVMTTALETIVLALIQIAQTDSVIGAASEVHAENPELVGELSTVIRGTLEYAVDQLIEVHSRVNGLAEACLINSTLTESDQEPLIALRDRLEECDERLSGYIEPLTDFFTESEELASLSTSQRRP